MKNSERILKILYVTLTISLILVWGQSCLNKEQSTVSSDFVIDRIEPVDELKNGDEAAHAEYQFLHDLVRKLAHVIEYAAVGFQVMCILYLRKKDSLKYYAICLYFGLTVGFLDESIQILSSRGPLILDLWIDLGGVVVGILAAFVLRAVIQHVTSRKELKVTA